MQYGVHIGATGEYADIPTLIRLARTAEDAGWDGFFVWDHVSMGGAEPLVDPWLALTAVALHTARLRLGPMVTPLARRHPWKLARETVTLDRLSGGRVILGVGLGDIPAEFEYLGEPGDLKVRAGRLDEGLAVLTGLWSGEPFQYRGTYYQVQEAQFVPTPIQTPRIPIWVAGFWPHKGPFRRAARWDGVFPGKVGLAGDALLPLDDLRVILAYIQTQRRGSGPFDVVLGGATPGDDPAQSADRLAPYADAGLTWWLESIHAWRGDVAAMEQRIRQGPPK